MTDLAQNTRVMADTLGDIPARLAYNLTLLDFLIVVVIVGVALWRISK